MSERVSEAERLSEDALFWVRRLGEELSMSTCVIRAK